MPNSSGHTCLETCCEEIHREQVSNFVIDLSVTSWNHDIDSVWLI